EGDDGGAGVDDELPSIAEPEQRAGDGPDGNNRKGQEEGDRSASRVRHPLGEAHEPQPLILHIDTSSAPCADLITPYDRLRVARLRGIRTRRSSVAGAPEEAR